MRGATIEIIMDGTGSKISIHAPHAGRDFSLVTRGSAQYVISIHAPHAGRDGQWLHEGAGAQISIHAPHAGRDHF